MKKLIIVGAGGFARECAWLIEQINAATPEWDIVGMSAEEPPVGSLPYPYLGSDQQIPQLFANGTYFCVGIGTPAIRRRLTALYENMGFLPATLIHPEISLSESVQVGEGSVLCAGVKLTVNIQIGRFVILNLNTTIGHDAIVGDFLYNISGCKSERRKLPSGRSIYRFWKYPAAQSKSRK